MRKGEELRAPRHASAAATRDYTWYIPDTHKALPLFFYNFLKINLKTKSKFLRRKIVNTNIKKFLKGKPGLTYKDIL